MNNVSMPSKGTLVCPRVSALIEGAFAKFIISCRGGEQSGNATFSHWIQRDFIVSNEGRAAIRSCARRRGLLDGRFLNSYPPQCNYMTRACVRYMNLARSDCSTNTVGREIRGVRINLTVYIYIYISIFSSRHERPICFLPGKRF